MHLYFNGIRNYQNSKQKGFRIGGWRYKKKKEKFDNKGVEK